MFLRNSVGGTFRYFLIAKHGIYHVRIYIWHGKKLVLAREEGGGGSTVKIALFI